jgi:peroxiredoxin
VPIAIRLLDDPEPRVVVAAALLLHKATGQDFGSRSSHALPQFICIGTNPPPPPDLPVIRHGVERWKEWWANHQTGFQAPLATEIPHGDAVPLPTADFTLDDSADKPIRLSQFRSKTVLLCFWGSDTPASLDDTPALRKLQQHNPDRLAVIGICLPAAPSCTDEHEYGHESAHHHHGESGGSIARTEHMRCLVQDAITRIRINYPMIADTKGAIGQRFSIADLPAYVLIDAQGKVRRRFVGFRTEAAFAAMVEEATTPRAIRASAN